MKPDGNVDTVVCNICICFIHENNTTTEWGLYLSIAKFLNCICLWQ